jgi:hypothetical protein
MDKLTERPAEMEENLLKVLYESARINKLSEKEMEAYHQSILDYFDVRLAVNYARNEGIEIGRKEGREIGRKEGKEQERINSVKSLYDFNMGIDLIVKYTGFTEEQIHKILNNG